MVGLPGSGKSEFAEKYAKETDSVVISSDQMREQLYGDVNEQSKNNELFDIIDNAIINSLKCKQSIILDATNISRKKRINLLNKLAKIDCEKKCIIMATPYETCISSNHERERQIPDEVINRMYMKWQTPAYFEGWDDIRLVYRDEADKKKYSKPEELVLKLMEYDQKNSFHSKTLGNHLADTAAKVRSMNYEDEDLVYAALIHDIGKPYTQIYKEGDSNAHYYDHQNVGAYDCFFIDFPRYVDRLDISLLVNLHMDPYFWDSQKVMEKKQKLWGDTLFRRVMALHGADQYEH